MAKVQIKSEKISAFGGIFFVLDKFDSILSSVIDSHLGLRNIHGESNQIIGMAKKIAILFDIKSSSVATRQSWSKLHSALAAPSVRRVVII